jgi:hypothetical protein
MNTSQVAACSPNAENNVSGLGLSDVSESDGGSKNIDSIDDIAHAQSPLSEVERCTVISCEGSADP